MTELEAEVSRFYGLRPVLTDGALMVYTPTFEEVDDGDVYVKVTLPVWSQNETVVSSVLHTVARFRREWDHVSFYAREGAIELRVYFGFCDPD